MSSPERVQSPPLFIGRFQPFHKGHLDAIKQILSKHPRVIIGIGSAQYHGLPQNPFSASLRARMITQSLREEGIARHTFTLVKIPDIHDDKRWVAHVEKLSPPFGEIWSGEPIVRRLFKKNSRHRIRKPKFNRNISATEIRRRMQSGKAWQHHVPSIIIPLIHGHKSSHFSRL